MILLVKPGTHAGCYMRVKGLRKKPVVGQAFEAKRSNPLGKTEPGAKWERWRVCLIKEGYFGEEDRRYFLEAA